MPAVDLTKIDLETMEHTLGIKPWRISFAAGSEVTIDRKLIQKLLDATTIPEMYKVRAEAEPGSMEERVCWVKILGICETIEQVDSEMRWLVSRSTLLPLVVARRDELLRRDLAIADSLETVREVYSKTARGSDIQNEALLKLTTFFPKA